MKKLFLILIAFCLIIGCSKNKDNCKIKLDFTAYAHNYIASSYCMTFIEGHLPYKTYLGFIDLSTNKIKKLNFENHGLYAPHELIPFLNQAICSSENVHSDTMKPKILIIDPLKNNTILKEFLLPPNNLVTFIKNPSWSQEAFVLLKVIDDYGEDQNKVILKKINLSEQSISKTIFDYNLKLNNALFLENSPILLLDTISPSGEFSLIIYDLKNNSQIKQIITEAPCIEIKQDLNSNKVYALMQSLSENNGKIYEISTDNIDIKPVAEIPGEVETMQLIENNLLVISKDLTRTQEQKKRWLHARNLFFIDLNNGTVKDKTNWTQRCGKFKNIQNLIK